MGLNTRRAVSVWYNPYAVARHGRSARQPGAAVAVARGSAKEVVKGRSGIIGRELYHVFLTYFQQRRNVLLPGVELFSVGHSNVPVERLVEMLRLHRIATVCHVRGMPYSRYNPQFNREALAHSLVSAGLNYLFMGDSLGGKPQDPSLMTEDGALPDYDRIAQSPSFLDGLARLIELGRQMPTACMCGEADYRNCHRHRLIAPALIERDVTVWHILQDGSVDLGEVAPRQIRMF